MNAKQKQDYEKLSDLELAERLVARDPVAVRLVTTRNNQRLYRAAWSILRNRAEAEDAVQSAYLHAFAAIGEFAGRSSLTTWLTRIVINEAIGRARKLARRDAMAPIGELDDDAAALASDSAAPEREAIRGELRRSLQKRIEALPGSLRAVFVLRAVEELSVAETAHALGITDGAVRVRFFRARDRLRRALEGAFA